MKTLSVLLLFFFIASSNPLFAQDDTEGSPTTLSSKSGKSKFMMRGYAHSGFEFNSIDGDISNDFVSGSIAPVIMFKQSDRLFFEAEFEGSYSNGNFNWGLEYSNVSLVLHDNIIFRGGIFLVPFGAFGEKLHPAWINKVSTAPLGFGHDGLVPGSDVGVEFRGTFNIGSVKFNYQAYATNGPQLKDGTEEPEEAGMLNFGVFSDNNNDKAVGGRLAFFPMANSMMELGFSGMTAKVGDKDSDYEDVRANLFAVDLSLAKSLGFMKSIVDLKAQYNYAQLSNANYLLPSEEEEEHEGGRSINEEEELYYDFRNVSHSFYAQLALRPALAEAKVIKDIEFVGRYSRMMTPEGALWEQSPNQFNAGINYWLNWRTVVKLGYQLTEGGLAAHDDGGGDGHRVNVEDDHEDRIKDHLLYLHVAIGF